MDAAGKNQPIRPTTLLKSGLIFGVNLLGLISNMSTANPLPGLTLQTKISCPRCWNSFAPEETLWVAEHPDLLGDPKLVIPSRKDFCRRVSQ